MINYIQITQKRAYKRNIRVIFVSIIPYSQYILIYYINKSAKRGGTHKNLISSKPPHKCKSEYIRKSLYIYMNIYKVLIIIPVKYVH